MDLKGNSAVITGSAQGLGRIIAEALVKEGASVVISDLREADVAKTAGDLGAFGVAADVTNEDDVVRLASAARGRFGRIDLWINNAGVWMPQAAIEALDMRRVRAMFDVNVFGTMHGTRAALAVMRAQGRGTIVNILSTSALSGRPQAAAYCASKYAAAGFTKSLQAELAGTAIRALAVYPGAMKTGLFHEQAPSDFDEYMSAESVAAKIIENLKKDPPDDELVIRGVREMAY